LIGSRTPSFDDNASQMCLSLRNLGPMARLLAGLLGIFVARPVSPDVTSDPDEWQQARISCSTLFEHVLHPEWSAFAYAGSARRAALRAVALSLRIGLFLGLFPAEIG
jgi:hypothetical protein